MGKKGRGLRRKPGSDPLRRIMGLDPHLRGSGKTFNDKTQVPSARKNRERPVSTTEKSNKKEANWNYLTSCKWAGILGQTRVLNELRKASNSRRGGRHNLRCGQIGGQENIQLLPSKNTNSHKTNAGGRRMTGRNKTRGGSGARRGRMFTSELRK